MSARLSTCDRVILYCASESIAEFMATGQSDRLNIHQVNPQESPITLSRISTLQSVSPDATESSHLQGSSTSPYWDSMRRSIPLQIPALLRVSLSCEYFCLEFHFFLYFHSF